MNTETVGNVTIIGTAADIERLTRGSVEFDRLIRDMLKWFEPHHIKIYPHEYGYTLELPNWQPGDKWYYDTYADALKAAIEHLVSYAVPTTQ